MAESGFSMRFTRDSHALERRQVGGLERAMSRGREVPDCALRLPVYGALGHRCDATGHAYSWAMGGPEQSRRQSASTASRAERRRDPDALARVADAVNARLGALRLVPTELVSDGYSNHAFNGLGVLRLELRPDMAAAGVDPKRNAFGDDIRLLETLADDTSASIIHDSFGVEAELSGHDIGHYLCDANQERRIVEALNAFPAISDAERSALVELYRSS